MQCPWCEQQPADFDEMQAHMLKYHPEVTQLADYQESKVQRIWGTAVDLTIVCYGYHKDPLNKEVVMETYRFFLRELMKSEK
jgi:hypothetical protein